jgi:hypothetical protein
MLYRRHTRALGIAVVSVVATTASATHGVEVASRTSAPAHRATEVIARWNAIALEAAATGPFSPPRETRALAIVSAAVFDAVMSITDEYDPYIVRVRTSRDASIESAITAAAHDVLVSLYPHAAPALNALRDSILLAPGDHRVREDGAQVGRLVAIAVLARRAGDRATDAATYTASPSHGVWAPTAPGFVPAMEPGWGRVRPFLLDSGSQFRPGPPPGPDSDAYRRDYQEIVAIGSSNSATRTGDQTAAGRFWVATAAQRWNQLVRHLALTRTLSPSEAARTFLLLNLAGADAMIAAWDAKYTYNQWRPITAIRSRSSMPAGSADSLWAPLIVTPPFPDYPAGHTAYAGAAERVLTEVFGAAPGVLSIASGGEPAQRRHYRTFADIAEEVTNARVWAGVHWRESSIAGRALGRIIGDWAIVRAPGRVIK